MQKPLLSSAYLVLKAFDVRFCIWLLAFGICILGWYWSVSYIMLQYPRWMYYLMKKGKEM